MIMTVPVGSDSFPSVDLIGIDLGIRTPSLERAEAEGLTRAVDRSPASRLSAGLSWEDEKGRPGAPLAVR